MFSNVLIIGCGLIGSSILGQLKKNKLAKNVIVFDKSKEVVSFIKTRKSKCIILQKI